MTALDPSCPENAAEAPSPKWTSERVAFITEQYLIYRKSGGEIARMLGPAFTRNSVTGKLFRTGALKARSGMGLGSDHGLPRGANFGNPRSGSRKKLEDAKPSVPAKQSVEERPQAEPGGADFVKKTEALFEIDGIAVLKAKGDQCCWPARSVDGAAYVCGAPKARGAYCETHAAIAYRSASPQARDPGPRSANRPHSRKERGPFWRGVMTKSTRLRFAGPVKDPSPRQGVRHA